MHVVAEVPSFESVAERHLDDVHAYLVYLTRDRGVAEDLTAETFEKALRQWRRFDPRRGSARTWLCQIARTTALDHFRAEERRRRRERARTRRRAEHVEDGLFGGLSPELERALAALSAGEREVIALRVLLDLDQRDGRPRPRHLHDHLRDAAEPCPEEARREDERRCRRLTTTRSSTRSARSTSRLPPSSGPACARSPRPRRRPHRRGAASCRGGGRFWCWRPPPLPSRSPRRSPSGSSTPGRRSTKDAVRRQAAPSKLALTGPASDTVLPARAEKGAAASGGGASTSAGSAGNLPATPGRAQLYDAELTLKINDLSTATKQALRLTHDFHGYVRSVDYGSGTERGSAYLVLRVPVESVQEAIVKFSALGRILDQHVSIQDVQPTVDKRFRQMQAQRDQITKLQAKLQDQSLTTAERAALADELVATQHTLLALQKQATSLARQTSFATVELDLRQGEKAVVVPHDPSRIGQAFHRSGQILVDEAKVLVYVLVVGAPLLALLALAAVVSRTWRRRAEAHLLSQ